MAKKFNSFSSLVYSTNPEAIPSEAPEHIPTPEPGQQQLFVRLDKKHRAGKMVTLIEGFAGNDDDRAALAKRLKTICGVGGSVKEGIIIIQGNFRDKILQWLRAQGYRAK